MEELVDEIRPVFMDRIINDMISTAPSTLNTSYTLHYNQNEEFFIQFDRSFLVPSFPIHHDVREASPNSTYLNALRELMDKLLSEAPDFFSDLTYFFDPTEIQKPCFYKLYSIQERPYLYLLRINMQYRPLESELVTRGTNDVTASYNTRRIYLESDMIPLASIYTQGNIVKSFVVKQTISSTWIGETGHGYLVSGIWMDMEFTKFFSKLFLPSGKRTYPFYPYTCKYKTMCMTIADPLPEARKRLLPYHDASISLVEGEIERIQRALKEGPFSEKHPLFLELKERVREGLTQPWTKLTIIPYLNENDQKEFLVEF